MSHKMLIDGNHPEETRVVVVSGNKVENFDFESSNKRQVSGNIYLAKVTRVEPSLQAAFLDYGGNRHGFLAFSEIHPDYYQIPKEDKEKLLEEAKAEAQIREDEVQILDEIGESDEPRQKSRVRRRKKVLKDSVAEEVSKSNGDVVSGEITINRNNGNNQNDNTISSKSDLEEITKLDVETVSKETKNMTPSISERSENKTKEISDIANEETELEVRRAAAKRTKSLIRQYNIQEVIKVRQIMLVQVVKEERGNKGAALTSYLSLAGRYCVLMPNTTRGGGISRKITNPNDRRRLKEITSNITVPETAGLIIRTAGINRTKLEIKRDYEYLIRQWENIRELTLKSIAPMLIYEEGSLIRRSIRDLYNKPTEEIIVQGEGSYTEAKDYMKMLMPSHAKNVKKYSDPIPLFARYQVETHLTAMFNPNVQLKSGGYIVIGITEALVAIDVNSGRSTRETSIEETALKTNLEASEEIARQLRLRDLAGLIVIDFIDMEDRKNNVLVERALYDRLKTDRARIQLGKISSFGLLEMSRQRLRSGMIEATTQPCPHCFGTGMTRSNESLGLAILRDIQQEINSKAIESVSVNCSVEVSNFLLNKKRPEISRLENDLQAKITINGDNSIVNPDYKITKEKSPGKQVLKSSDTVKASPNPKNNELDGINMTMEETSSPKKNRRKRKRNSVPENTSKNKILNEGDGLIEENTDEVTFSKAKKLKSVAKEKANTEDKNSKSVPKKSAIISEMVPISESGKAAKNLPKTKSAVKKRMTSADPEEDQGKVKKVKSKDTSKKGSEKKIGWWNRKDE